MARTAGRLLTLASLIAALASPAANALAQSPLFAPAAERRPTVRATPRRYIAFDQPSEAIAAPAPDAAPPEILQSLPRPPLEPDTLFQEAPTLGGPARDWEHPYFETDPLLDPGDWPRPGWFSGAEVGVIKPHVTNPMTDLVTTGLGRSIPVQIDSARLGWAAAPRLEVGYRLPSGFGEFSISDRYFNALGNDTVLGVDGPAARHTEFMVNYADFDYASRELTPNAGWGLKFRGGLRASQTFFGSRLDVPFAAASAGSGVFAERETSRSTALGPHFGVDVERRLARRSLSLLGNVDVADMFAKVRNNFYAAATTLTPTGGFDSGFASSHFNQEFPVLTAQFGLSWRPPRLPNSQLYLGYFGQFWYKFATNSNAGSGPFGTPVETHFDNQGIVLRWNLNL